MRDNRHRLTSELTLLGFKGTSGGQGGPQANAPRVGGSIDRDKVFIPSQAHGTEAIALSSPHQSVGEDGNVLEGLGEQLVNLMHMPVTGKVINAPNPRKDLSRHNREAPGNSVPKDSEPQVGGTAKRALEISGIGLYFGEAGNPFDSHTAGVTLGRLCEDYWLCFSMCGTRKLTDLSWNVCQRLLTALRR